MERPEPLVSVILPTYNRAFYLSRAIESVFSQNYRNIELIVIDDGSTDNTREVVEKIGDKRIVFMRTPTNRGVSSARNAGIRRAKGEYIAFQDSDDIWLPGKLAKQVEVLEGLTEDTAFVYCIMSRTNTAGVKHFVPDDSISRELRRGRLFKKLLIRNYIGAPAVCIRRSVLENVGTFDTQMPSLEDYDLLLRIAKNYRIEYIDEVLVDTFALSDSVNSNVLYAVVSQCIIIKKHEDQMKELGLYEHKLEGIRDFGEKINAKEQVEEIIRNVCGII